MSASNAFETALLTLYFNNTNNANIGDATGVRGSSTAGVFYIGLHTADPGETGTQSTSEATYTGYARVSTVRSAAGWTISGNTVSNAAVITYAICSGGSNVITHFSIGTDSSGVGNLLFSGALNSSITVSNGITPNFGIGDLTTTAD